ncbi:hypothetical protein IWX49DRAFT_587396 [Phyllosticta citricarpa]|uniref:Uncharacterized protein n=2 Tax=Phyllosticta TaxID=121621 RepID=A0ABR1MQF0_9PEZI
MASRAAPNTTRTRTAAAAGVPNEPSETYEERQRRYNAARVLESNEMLIWWSTVRNESIPQTRLHFENILAGFASDDSEPEWDDEPSGGPPPAGTPGVHVRFLFGENNKRGQADASSSGEGGCECAWWWEWAGKRRPQERKWERKWEWE